jgi:hypothetical protein
MKKITIILIILLSLNLYAQKPKAEVYRHAELTTTERDALSPNETDVIWLIYNKTNQQFEYYNGVSWIPLDTNTQVDISGKANKSGDSFSGNVSLIKDSPRLDLDRISGDLSLFRFYNNGIQSSAFGYNYSLNEFILKDENGSDFLTINRNSTPSNGDVFNLHNNDWFTIRNGANVGNGRQYLFMDIDLWSANNGNASVDLANNFHYYETGNQRVEFETDGIMAFYIEGGLNQNAWYGLQEGATHHWSFGSDASQNGDLRFTTGYGLSSGHTFTFTKTAYFGQNVLNPLAFFHSKHSENVNFHQPISAHQKWLFESTDDAVMQITSNNQGSVGTAILFSNQENATDGRHWVIEHAGTTENNNFGIGYYSSTTTEENIIGLTPQILTITTDEKFGFSETNPKAKAHVRNGADVSDLHQPILAHQDFLIESGNSFIQLGSDNSTNGSGILFSNQENATDGRHWVINQKTTDNSLRIGYYSSTTTEEDIVSLASAPFKIDTSGNTIMTNFTGTWDGNNTDNFVRAKGNISEDVTGQKTFVTTGAGIAPIIIENTNSTGVGLLVKSGDGSGGYLADFRLSDNTSKTKILQSGEITINSNLVYHQGNDSNLSKINTVNAFSKQQYTQVSSNDSASGAISWNLENEQNKELLLTGNITLSNPTNTKRGAKYTLIIKQDVTGSRTVNWGSNFEWGLDGVPTLTTSGNLTDILTFESDGTRLFCTSIKKAFVNYSLIAPL